MSFADEFYTKMKEYHSRANLMQDPPYNYVICIHTANPIRKNHEFRIWILVKEMYFVCHI